ncbi:hypothetical protein RMN57_04105 [Kitasatospora sp. CM 4170]|uniref:Uncharacterized protein n=1 Tax=Kitasatospora aburaviensis TaxID=67265 RepID=A0ABW1EW26_9ACTN|nr:hypothetical protein [Kitasatospora sp. CM 4170]WNM43945.1 hypothetical protein RMN57_04105 [Kitasatospora sp. CM 4170]
MSTAVEHRPAEVSRLWVAERAADGEVFDPEIAVWILSGLADLARARSSHYRRQALQQS